MNEMGWMRTVLAIALWLPGSQVQAAEAPIEQSVGVVAEYRPAAARFSLVRAPDEQQVPLRIGTVVMAGDRVSLPAGAAVVVQLADDTVRRFEGPGTFQVPPTRRLGKLAAIFSSIPALFDDEYRLAGTAGSRGSEDCRTTGDTVAPIEVPILVGGARIVAGERDLPLAWRGGCSPFVVTVFAQDRESKIVYRESVEGRQLRLDDVPLPAGRYSVVVTDSTGARFQAPLEALANGPNLPPEIASDSTPLGVAAQAVWMAEQDGGRWRLESFERLRPLIRAGNPMAGVIGDGLLWGRPTRP